MLMLGLALLSACGSSSLYPAREPITRDPDRRPFHAELEPYFSPDEWDHLDHSFFRPVTRFFAMAPGGEAKNVNALDEVPDSSWFDNRVEHLSPADMATGPCDATSPEAASPWRLVAAKQGGVHLGFVIEDATGQRHLIKPDTGMQGPRGSTADAVASRVYHASGFNVPCNQVVYFERSTLALTPAARAVLPDGEAVPMTWAHIEALLAQTWRTSDGRFRAVSSRYLEGRPLGPWKYHGTREGDRNDVVPHEDRRELRGSKLLAAWTGHWDAREQNTLAMWVDAGGGRGFIRHHLLDFGDCFGAFAGRSATWVRRRGEVYWFDPGQVLGDFASFGVLEHPWERAQLGPSGATFGFYDIERFDPETWSTSYPNPAFGRMTERDAAWMARIIARMGRPEVEAMVQTSKLSEPLRSELERILLGRRQKLLGRYLGRLSPLARPTVERDEEQSWLCADDLGALAGIARERRYSARAWLGSERRPISVSKMRSQPGGRVCAVLPTPAGASRQRPAYLQLEIATQPAPALPAPARFHLYYSGRNRYLLVALERPTAYDEPR